MSIVDNIRINQDWGPDGYTLEKGLENQREHFETYTINIKTGLRPGEPKCKAPGPGQAAARYRWRQWRDKTLNRRM